jgi:hypothetical protein
MMNPALVQNEVRYVISEDEVCSKASDLLNILVDGGVEPAGLSHDDFVSLIVKMKVTEFAYEAIDLGISIHNSRWTRVPDEGAEIVFCFTDVTSPVMFKMWLT